MPKKFTEFENTMIKKQLLVEGKRLFESVGFNKTSIDRIVDAVGIAKGSFYKFYKNKESLFYDILEDIEVNLHQQAIHDLETNPDTIEAFKNMMTTQISWMMNEPLFKMSLDTTFIMVIWSRLPEEKKISSEQLDLRKMSDIQRILKKRNLQFRYDYKITSGILRSLAHTLIHPELMGESIDEVRRFFINTVDQLFIEIIQ